MKTHSTTETNTTTITPAEQRTGPATRSLHALSDDELISCLGILLSQVRATESELVAHIGEVDRRRLYLREASSSMFAYCTDVLHLSEHEAYLRISVARAARKHQILLTMLADGRLHLSAIARLAPHLDRLDPAARKRLLNTASHSSKREIAELLAALDPKPDVPSCIRRLPQRRQQQPVRPETRPTVQGKASLLAERSDELGPDRVNEATTIAGASASRQDASRQDASRQDASSQDASSQDASSQDASSQDASSQGTCDVGGVPRRGSIEPLARERYKVTFTAGLTLREKLERLQALMPGQDLAEVVESAVDEKLTRLEARRFGKVRTPRKSVQSSDVSTGSRHVPSTVKRTVFERDGGQCTFVNAGGIRCRSRENLEFHHDRPFALGGDRSPENIRLLCRSHNLYLAEATYGVDLLGAPRGAAPT